MSYVPEGYPRDPIELFLHELSYYDRITSLDSRIFTEGFCDQARDYKLVNDYRYGILQYELKSKWELVVSVFSCFFPGSRIEAAQREILDLTERQNQEFIRITSVVVQLGTQLDRLDQLKEQVVPPQLNNNVFQLQSGLQQAALHGTGLGTQIGRLEDYMQRVKEKLKILEDTEAMENFVIVFKQVDLLSKNTQKISVLNSKIQELELACQEEVKKTEKITTTYEQTMQERNSLQQGLK